MIALLTFDDDNLENSGSAKNLSNESFSVLDIEVVLTDCAGLNKCETVGRGLPKLTRRYRPEK
jgi:hypothetical protein